MSRTFNSLASHPPCCTLLYVDMTAHYNVPAMAKKREVLGRVIQLVRPDPTTNPRRDVEDRVEGGVKTGAQM